MTAITPKYRVRNDSYTAFDVEEYNGEEWVVRHIGFLTLQLAEQYIRHLVACAEHKPEIFVYDAKGRHIMRSAQ